MVVKQSDDSIIGPNTGMKTISLERLSTDHSSSSTLNNLEMATLSSSTNTANFSSTTKPTIVNGKTHLQASAKAVSVTNKKLFENFLNQNRLDIKSNVSRADSRPFSHHLHNRLINNSTLSLNEELTFELIKASSRNQVTKTGNDEHESVGGNGIVQKSLPDLMNCALDCDGKLSRHESNEACEDQASLNDDEVITSSSLSTSSSASEAAQSTASSNAESNKNEDMPAFESSSLSSSHESTRYLSSDDSSADDSQLKSSPSTSLSSRKSPSKSDLNALSESSSANNAIGSDEDDDGIVFSSDMTVIIDRADFLNTVTDDDELDEYSSRRETVTFSKIFYNKNGLDDESKSPRSDQDNISSRSDKSLSNYLVNKTDQDEEEGYSSGGIPRTKLVNSISDENIESLNGQVTNSMLLTEVAAGSTETPSSFFGKSRADSSLLNTSGLSVHDEKKTSRELTKQSSFLSSGKSTISSAHSNSLACEVASLSSMTSDYSQFEFLNNNNASAAAAVASHSDKMQETLNAKSGSVTSNGPVSSNGSSGGGLTSFFFSNGLFGSAKKQKNLMSSTLATSDDKSVKLVVSSPSGSNAVANQTGSPSAMTVPASESSTAISSRLDSFTNKLLNFKPSTNKNSFNVTSPSASQSTSSSNNISKFFFSSSSSSNKPSSTFTQTSAAGKSETGSKVDVQSTSSHPASPSSVSGQHHNDNISIKSNHSVNNLSSIVAGLQVPNSVLIFENRPSNLPAKSQQEALKHQREYEKMVEIAKKKEQKEKEMKLKKYEQQMRKEDFMANSLKIWNQEILVNWSELKDAKRTHQLWWHGLPPSIRGKVWRLAIGNELNLTKESYYFYERKAQEKLDMLNKLNSNSNDLNEEEKRAMSASLDQDRTHESSVELIKLDVSRTFPQLCFFQRDGPYHDALHSVLGAYACYNTKIGYVQGMSFLTAILLLNMEAPDAFICLSNLLNTKYLLACFCMNQAQMNRYFKAHQILLEHNLPKLYRHFEEQKVKPDLYLIEWIFTLFSKSLPLDVVSRVWDVFLRDHEEFLFRTALGILNLYKDTLLKMDFIHIVQFLTKLPETINSTQLFKSIEQISTTIDETYFTFEHLIGDI